MIEKCNFRNKGIYGKDSDKFDFKEYCSLKTHDTFLYGSEKNFNSGHPDSVVKVNSLCSGEDKCILYQMYKKLVENDKLWNEIYGTKH